MKSIRKLSDLSGRVALVTGAAGRLGRTICETLAELGASIAVLDLKPEACEQAASSLRKAHGVAALPIAVDLANTQKTREVSGTILSHFSRLDVLVHCAALVGTSDLQGWAVPFTEQAPEPWRAALEVNLTAPFVLTQACIPALRSSSHGSIVNVASIYGMVGPDWRLYQETQMGNPAAYAASKGGLLQLTRWLATTLAPDVRVNAISLGGVARSQASSFIERYVSKTPLGRMATEEDIKGAVVYLATDLSAYVTGHNLVVDGGWTSW